MTVNECCPLQLGSAQPVQPPLAIMVLGISGGEQEAQGARERCSQRSQARH